MNNPSVCDFKIGNNVLFNNGSPTDIKDVKLIEATVIELKGFSNGVTLQFDNPDKKKAVKHPKLQRTIHASHIIGKPITKKFLFDFDRLFPEVCDNENFIVVKVGYLHGYVYFTINPDNGVTYIQVHTNGDEIKIRRAIKYEHQFINLVYEITEVVL